MLSFKKIIYITLVLISACSFDPVYTNSNSSNLLGKISIQEPSTQSEFIFYSQLIDRFGDRGNKYTLNYAISTSNEDRVINFDGTVHRIEISGSVLFNLKESETGTEILSDRAEIHLSYSNAGSTAAVLNAERVTSKQLTVLLADKVADRILLAIFDKSL
jgi:hypothetical protein